MTGWIAAIALGLLAAGVLAAPARRAAGLRGVIGLAAAVTLITVGAYAIGGSPGLPGEPYAEAQARRAAADPAQMSDAERFKRLEEVVRQRPDDPTARTLLARELLRRGRPLQAVEAYRAAARLDPNAGVFTELGQAIMVLNEGELTPEALSAFRAALQQNPDALEPAFYVLASEFEADPCAETALALARLAAEAETADARGQALISAIFTRLSQPRRGPQTGGGQAPPNIEAMVTRLEDRLADNPGDVGLYLTLARVKAALGDAAGAGEALAALNARFPDEAGVSRLAGFAQSALQLQRGPGE